MGAPDSPVFVSTIADAAPGASRTLVGEDCTETLRVDRRVPPKTCSMLVVIDQALLFRLMTCHSLPAAALSLQ